MLNNLLLFVHLAAAIVWLGGMSLMLVAVRPALLQVAPPLRLQLLLGVLRRFFALVWCSIALLLASGGGLLAHAGGFAPAAWQAMAGIGALMSAVFVWLFFVPYRRALRAAQDARWPQAGAALLQVHRLVQLNFGLGWLAVALVVLWR